MNDDERLADLLIAWEDRFDQGEDLPAEELCPECPELIPSLAKQIQALKMIDRRFGVLRRAGQKDKEVPDFVECMEKADIVNPGTVVRICLRGISGDIEGKRWESSSILRAGRLATLEAALNDGSVSRRHAEVRLTVNGWVVRDLGSTNGTFLNGAKLGNGEHPISMHDIIRFGNVTFVVDLLEIGLGHDAILSDFPAPSQVDDEWLAALLIAWEDCFEQGEDVPAEELCRDCPELAPMMAKQIRTLKIAWLNRSQAEKREPQQAASSDAFAEIHCQRPSIPPDELSKPSSWFDSILYALLVVILSTVVFCIVFGTFWLIGDKLKRFFPIVSPIIVPVTAVFYILTQSGSNPPPNSRR